MSGIPNRAHWSWRDDLAAFKGLSDREKAGYLLVLEWFRLR